MKVSELAGQWVWVEAGMPVLFATPNDGPGEVGHDHIVRVERIEPATTTRPALAIWSDAEGTYGVDVDRVRHSVVSLPPSGNSPVVTAAEALTRLVKRSGGG